MNRLIRKIFLCLFQVARFVPGSARSSFGCRVRVFLLGRLARSCGNGVNVLANADIGAPHNLTIGDHSGIGLGCYLSCLDEVLIGSRVLMGPGVMIFTSNHVWNELERTYFQQGESLAPVVIKDDAWIGARSVILPGVTIGRGCTVAAGSVVTRSTADYSTVAGVPAVQIHIKPTI
jgi:maltose O-acetyltransferase